jgi:GABA(A) receptor-associated protein
MTGYVQGEFKTKYSDEHRLNESTKIISKYPNRIPVIVETVKGNNVGVLDKQKYLVPNDLTVGQFAYIIRKRVKLLPEKAMYLMVGNKIPTTASTMQSVYDSYVDVDGFLYINISGENTYG